MATKVSERDKADQATPEAPPTSDGPLLDLTDQAVRRMIKLAKKRGYVTYDELNEVLPSEEFSSEQIEDVLGHAQRAGHQRRRQRGSRSLRRGTRRGPHRHQRPRRGRGRGRRSGRRLALGPAGRDQAQSGADRAHRRSGADVSARDGFGRVALPRGRDRDRQAHRGWSRGDDRRALREPADLPGDHHLARRAERSQGSAARHHRPRSDLCRPRRQEPDADRGRGRRGRGRAGRRGRGARRRPASRSRRRRHGEQRVALGHGGRAQAARARDVRFDRRQLQEAAPPAGSGHRQPAGEHQTLAVAGPQVQEAQGRHHHRGEVALAEQQPYRGAGRAALRHQQAPDLA